MSFVSDIRPVLDEIRGITGEVGLCDVTVTVKVRTWSSDNIAETGEGFEDVDTRLLVGGQNPKVRRVAYKQTVAGGGKYQEGDYRVGPMTSGVMPFSRLAPPSSPGTEVYYILVGSDTPAEGTVCTAVGIEGDHPLHSYLVLRPTGATL